MKSLIQTMNYQWGDPCSSLKPLVTKALLVFSGGLMAVSVHATTIDLTGLGYVQYGDGQSYSLPIANYQYGYKTNTGPFAIQSTAGAIKDLVVLGTGASGSDLVHNFDGMDNAYATPSGANGETFFYSNQVTNQGSQGTITNNLSNTWDASLGALKNFLAGDQMVFFFNNNQINSGASSDQNLAVWARLWITLDNAIVNGSIFEFTNRNSPYNLVSMGGGGVFMGDVSTYNADPLVGDPVTYLPSGTDFVLSGGGICVATGAGLPAPIPVPCGTSLAAAQVMFGPLVQGVSAQIDHNLGADHAAYAVLFPELNTKLNELFGVQNIADYTLHVDVRMGCAGRNVTTDNKSNFVYGANVLDPWMSCEIANNYGTAMNNGYEQLFLGTATVGTCPVTDPACNPTVPEPAPIALLGVGFAMLGFQRHLRNIFL